MGELFATHGRLMIRFAYFLTGDRDLAEDIAQEAFVRVSTKLLTLRNPDRAGAYLRQTVVNLARSHARRAARETRALTKLRTHRTWVQSTPDEPIRDVLWDLLLQLPTRQRAALFLRHYEGRSESEIADTLGCSISAVKSLLVRATTRLRNDLRKEAIDG